MAGRIAFRNGARNVKCRFLCMSGHKARTCQDCPGAGGKRARRSSPARRPGHPRTGPDAHAAPSPPQATAAGHAAACRTSGPMPPKRRPEHPEPRRRTSRCAASRHAPPSIPNLEANGSHACGDTRSPTRIRPGSATSPNAPPHGCAGASSQAIRLVPTCSVSSFSYTIFGTMCIHTVFRGIAGSGEARPFAVSERVAQRGGKGAGTAHGHPFHAFVPSATDRTGQGTGSAEFLQCIEHLGRTCPVAPNRRRPPAQGRLQDARERDDLRGRSPGPGAAPCRMKPDQSRPRTRGGGQEGRRKCPLQIVGSPAPKTI